MNPGASDLELVLALDGFGDGLHRQGVAARRKVRPLQIALLIPGINGLFHTTILLRQLRLNTMSG